MKINMIAFLLMLSVMCPLFGMNKDQEQLNEKIRKLELTQPTDERVSKKIKIADNIELGMGEEENNADKTVNNYIAHLIYEESHDLNKLKNIFYELTSEGVKDETIKKALAVEVYGMPILCWAVYKFVDGNLDIIKLLLERGAVSKDNPVVMWALEQQHNKDLAKLLIEAQQGINAPNYDGLTPLEWAMKEKDDSLKELLLDNGVYTNNKPGQELLSEALKNNNKVMALRLVKNGADIDYAVEYKEEKGVTRLILAVLTGQLNRAELLLECGAEKSINQQVVCKEFSRYGFTPLLLATYNNDLEMADLLLKHGAEKSINIQLPSDIPCDKAMGFWIHFTPLLFAVFDNNLKMAKLLLKYGAKASVNVPVEPPWSIYCGTTPIETAVSKKNLEMVKLLLYFGAEITDKIKEVAQNKNETIKDLINGSKKLEDVCTKEELQEFERIKKASKVSE